MQTLDREVPQDSRQNFLRPHSETHTVSLRLPVPAPEEPMLPMTTRSVRDRIPGREPFFARRDEAKGAKAAGPEPFLCDSV